MAGEGLGGEHMQYEFKNFHKVPAAAFFCLDPRFFDQTVAFLKEELGFDKFDAYAMPSGPRVLVKNETREVMLGNIERVSIGLHHIKEVILVAHRDCGAYGGSVAFAGSVEEKATQVEDLKIARGILSEKFPNLEVSMYYAEIVGDKIEFHPVK